MFFNWLGLYTPWISAALYLSFSRDEEVDMLQKLALTGSTLILGSSLLTGCAQMMEGMLANTEGAYTPPNAPPGYHTFRDAQKKEKEEDSVSALIGYCWAAELGHPQGKQKCIELAFRAGQFDKHYVCYAEDYDAKAREICKMTDSAKARKEIKSVINKQQKSKMQKRIQSGEFSDFKAEEF